MIRPVSYPLRAFINNVAQRSTSTAAVIPCHVFLFEKRITPDLTCLGAPPPCRHCNQCLRTTAVCCTLAHIPFSVLLGLNSQQTYDRCFLFTPPPCLGARNKTTLTMSALEEKSQAADPPAADESEVSLRDCGFSREVGCPPAILKYGCCVA